MEADIRHSPSGAAMRVSYFTDREKREILDEIVAAFRQSGHLGHACLEVWRSGVRTNPKFPSAATLQNWVRWYSGYIQAKGDLKKERRAG